MLITSYHQSSSKNVESVSWAKWLFNSLIFQVVDTDTEDASHPGISAYQFMLEQNVGKTMLQFQVRVRESINYSDISHTVRMPATAARQASHCTSKEKLDFSSHFGSFEKSMQLETRDTIFKSELCSDTFFKYNMLQFIFHIFNFCWSKQNIMNQ